MGIKPGDAITFKVRTFRTTEGEETWDFGDGTPAVKVKSDGNVKPLAKDGYAPRAFAARGDRLAYSNGIVILAGFSILSRIDRLTSAITRRLRRKS